MERFKYYPPLFITTLFFLTLTGLFLLFLEFKGVEAWTWIMEKTSLDVFVIIIGFAIYLLIFWGVGIPYLLLDRFKKPYSLYKYKIQDIPEERKRKLPKVPLPKAIARVLANQFLGTLPFLTGLFYLMVNLGYTINVAIPTWWVALLQLAGLILIEDVLFFAAHRTMHRKYFFKKIHRVHHEYRESIAIATHYVHFIEHLLAT